ADAVRPRSPRRMHYRYPGKSFRSAAARWCATEKSAFEDSTAMHNLRPMEAAFYQSESDQPHPGRARAIIKAHPEVRRLMVRNPWTALIAVSILAMQTAIAFEVGQLGVGYCGLSLVIAFCVVAVANHANYVTIHDATHNLIF